MNLRQAILATLSYHDIFNYPLKLEQVHSLLIEKTALQNSVVKEIANLQTQKKIGKKSEYFFLRNRSNLVSTRKLRGRYSKNKFKKASFFALILRLIPTVKMVAVSGALAMNNSHKNDDIDLVIITSRGALWTTRFFSNLLLLPFKRDPKGQNVSDRACLNLFLDESALKIKEQNLYTAHEIAQLKLLWDRDSTYERFLKANIWTKKYLPNWAYNAKGPSLRSLWRRRTSSKDSGISLIEKLLRSFQIWYMQNKATSEKIGDKQLFFHPKDISEQITSKYQKKLKQLHIDK